MYHERILTHRYPLGDTISRPPTPVPPYIPPSRPIMNYPAINPGNPMTLSSSAEDTCGHALAFIFAHPRPRAPEKKVKRSSLARARKTRTAKHSGRKSGRTAAGGGSFSFAVYTRSLAWHSRIQLRSLCHTPGSLPLALTHLHQDFLSSRSRAFDAPPALSANGFCFA